jgi:protein CpxP
VRLTGNYTTQGGKQMNTTWKTLSVAAALFAGVGMAHGAPQGCIEENTPGHSSGHLKKMAKELGLDDQQKVQVKDILKSNHNQIKPLMDTMITERRAMRSLIHAETIDEVAIRAQAAKMASLQADLAVNRAHIAQKLRSVLTPDQVQKFKTLQEKREQRMKERHSKGSSHTMGQ